MAQEWVGARWSDELSCLEVGSHPQESLRLEALKEVGLLDTATEELYEKTCTMAAKIFGAKYSFVTLVSENRQIFKATHGVEVAENAKNTGLCAYCVATESDGVELCDLSEEENFACNPLVGNGFIRYYASFLLRHPRYGLPLGALCVCHPEPMKAEPWQMEALRTLRGHIEQNFALRLEQKRQQVLIEQLQLSQQTAEQATAALQRSQTHRNEFFSFMVHELRTPVHSVIGMCELLAQTNQTEQQIEYTESISSSSTALLGLVNALMDFRKLEENKMEIHVAPFSLIDCLETSLAQVSHPAGQKNLDMGYIIDPTIDNVDVLGDVVKLRQLLVNLLSNAVKFTERGQIELRAEKIPESEFQRLKQIHARPELNSTSTRSSVYSPEVEDPQEASPVYFRFSVRDTGIGLSPTQIERLFQPFTQAAASVSSMYGGTGLGLSLCWKLANLMDGVSWVTSEQGVGCTFSFVAALNQFVVSSPSTVPSVPSECAEPEREPDGAKDRATLIRQFLQQSLTTPPVRRRMFFGVIATAGTVTAEMVGSMMVRCRVLHETTHSLAGLRNIFSDTTQRVKICFLDSELLRDVSHPVAVLKQLRAVNTIAKIILLYLPQDAGLRAEVEDYIDGSTLRYVKYNTIRRHCARLARKRRSTSMPAGMGFPMVPVTAPSVFNTNLRILIVDDNRVNALVAKRMLNHIGFTKIYMARNGKEAVDCVVNGPKHFHIILMDTNMPVMNGLDATRTIRASSRKKQPYIVSTTALGQPEEICQSLEAGMDTHLVKPISLESMQNLIREYARITATAAHKTLSLAPR